MAKITVDGTVQLTKSGSTAVVTLWETKLNQTTQQDQKTTYKLWLPVPTDWTDGTWVEVTGDLSVRPSMNQDGTPRTYVNSKGHTITAHDLNINDVTIGKVKIKNTNPDNIDLDDARKYGTLGQFIADDNPF